MQTESSQQNDEWSCSTDDWNYIEQSSTTKNSNIQTYSANINSDLTSNSYPVPDPNNGTGHSSVNSNIHAYNFNNGLENGLHTFPINSNNWFDKSGSQLEQITNTKHTVTNQAVDNKCDNIVETDDNFWADVENREILPPESFQNDTLPITMNTLQISDEVSFTLIAIKSYF